MKKKRITRKVCAKCGSSKIKTVREATTMDPVVKANLGQIYTVQYECKECGSWATKNLHPLAEDILRYFEDSHDSSKTHREYTKPKQ